MSADAKIKLSLADVYQTEGLPRAYSLGFSAAEIARMRPGIFRAKLIAEHIRLAGELGITVDPQTFEVLRTHGAKC